MYLCTCILVYIQCTCKLVYNVLQDKWQEKFRIGKQLLWGFPVTRHKAGCLEALCKNTSYTRYKVEIPAKLAAQVTSYSNVS